MSPVPPNCDNPVTTVIKCKYFNARSIRNKLNSFYNLIYSNVFNIVLITETWLCHNLSDGLLDPKGRFSIFRRDRICDSPSGGVCILVDINIQCNEIILSNTAFKQVEIIACSIRVNVRNILLVCCYIPPSLHRDQFNVVFDCLKSICTHDDITVITGDFNVSGIDWLSKVFPNDYKSRMLFDFYTDCGLTQIINEPTRLNNFLDLLFVSDPLVISSCEIDVPFCTSDHDSISFSICVESITVPGCAPSFPIPSFSWVKTDWDSFVCYLLHVDWSHEFSNCSCANDCWLIFYSVLSAAFQLYVPIKSACHPTKVRTTHTAIINKLINKKKCLWQKKKASPSLTNRAKYYKSALAVNCALNGEAEARELDIIKSGNLGLLYKHINVRLNHRSGIAPLANIDGQLVVSDADKAALLNECFADYGTSDDGLLPMVPDTESHISTKLEIIFFDSCFVRKCITDLKPNSAPGPDGLPAILFKKLSNQICVPLAIMFNLFIQFGQVPDAWKSAIVVPIFKKGASSKPENYRPISLTCLCSKFFEKGIKSHLMEHLAASHQISASQHGFLTKHSTCTNLLETLSDWSADLDASRDICVAYFDFAKAFDRVSIPKLLLKLNNAGVTGRLLSCIKSFLTNRVQSVRVGNAYSPLLSLRSGVPQGSVLGPVLFILFVNNIATYLPDNARSKLFADDLKSYVSIGDDNDKYIFQQVLDGITKWSATWQLPLSVAKCSWMLITNRPPATFDNYQLDCSSLSHLDETKDLGVLFNSKLNFSNHITSIIGKAKQRLFLICKSFHYSNSEALIIAFKTYVIPILEYCSQVWSPHSYSEIARIESVQRVFTKKLKSFEHLSYKDRLFKAGLCSLEHRRLIADLSLTYKILHGLTIADLDFQLAPGSSTRGHLWKLSVPKVRLNSRLFFFSVRVVNVWNALSDDTVNATSFNSFKSQLAQADLSKFLVIT